MPVKVINISKNHEDVLFFLYPDYSMSRTVDKCIFTEDIKSYDRMNMIKGTYNDAIVISRVLYDEMWDVERISEEVLKYCKAHFGCRRKSVKLSEDGLVDDAKYFITHGISVDASVEDNKLLELFSSFGTSSFPYKFFTLSDEVHPQTLIRSMLTFVTKVMVAPNPFYAKFNRMFAKRIAYNLKDALRFYGGADRDEYGIYFVNFCQMLIRR